MGQNDEAEGGAQSTGAQQRQDQAAMHVTGS